MGKTLRTVLIVILVFAIIFVPVVGSYNNLVSLDQQVRTSEANIEAQLQRRSDLIPNLVATVQGYASQEKEIFTSIAESRAKLSGAQTVEERANADAELSSALSRLLVVVERYPELKSNENFKDLTIALEGTENRIAIGREDYNKIVSKYNSKIRKFPTNIIASLFRFEEKPFYKATEGSKEVPKVEFK
ncbi:MAG: LemA family protein [Clostridium argentinense]|uniref:LemA family protein n=1 Tax=Clostridium faecium TaxID=2762223 RepID=A0ABR8YVR6_9CLOT|nr:MULTISPECIES: LemA family protein [Clostridium]MBD8048335.1 LemA family protein [Clostridium faecium]MBS5825086.1 LemA family protein [Clostridium argentinense]MDU1350930.1 LemA family protein [Clostridium argentinense]